MSDIGMTAGVVNHVTFDNFCASTSCYMSKLYDQGSSHLDITPNGSGTGFAALVVELTLTNGIHVFYAEKEPDGSNNALRPNVGYSTGTRAGGPNNGGMPGTPVTGAGVPTTQLWVVRSDVGNGCFDFGNAESTYTDPGDGHMFASKIETCSGPTSPRCFVHSGQLRCASY